MTTVSKQLPAGSTLPCGGCGGPHPFDTSIPSPTWNAVIRKHNAQSEFLCATCIIAAFVRANESFTAQLWSEEFSGTEIEVRIGSAEALDAARLSEENTKLRVLAQKLLVNAEHAGWCASHRGARGLPPADGNCSVRKLQAELDGVTGPK